MSKQLDVRLTRIENARRKHRGDHLTTFAYHGRRQTLPTDSTGAVVFSWDAAVAAICDMRP